MSFVPGVGFRPFARNMIGWAREWGTLRQENFRAVFNAVIPVSVVDRFRDNDEGSVFGLRVISGGISQALGPGEITAIIFFSTDPNVEFHVHSVNWHYDFDTTNAVFRIVEMGVMMYTPIAPHNPVAIAPVGLFVPGLITTEMFTFGSVRGIAGRSTVDATVPGFELNNTDELVDNSVLGPAGGIPQSSAYGVPFGTGSSQMFHADRRSQNTRNFDPPLRIRSFETIAFQMTQGNSNLFDDFDMSVSMLYTERRIIR